MKNYNIIESSSIKTLIQNVNLRINQGWGLQGGIAAYYIKNKVWYSQALIKGFSEAKKE